MVKMITLSNHCTSRVKFLGDISEVQKLGLYFSLDRVLDYVQAPDGLSQDAV